MEWTGLNELRERFLTFFESKAHTRMDSASLVPKGDNSLLLINSGMAPLKKFFLGTAQPPSKRVTTCQKCIRTPDIERVGKTARHGTFFEMLGNFSFGDYFKRDAIAWAWEFFTKELKLPEEKLHVSVFERDDEAYDIWTREIGVDPSHMVRLGREDNFWEHGEGPCGPCSEIYFDRGPEKGCGKPDCHVGCDCDRYVEVWNLVFSQYDSDGKGHYTEMQHKNIDTGMGLERLACVMQGADNLFEVDTIRNIMNRVCEIAGVKYHESEKTDVSLRVITDHIRSTVFMVGDGITPANDGRGYVLKRLLRRAARHGRLLGIHEPFLYDAAQTVIAENECAYPELREKSELITQIIRHEEESFARTVDRGMEMLNAEIKTLRGAGETQIPGKTAFALSDTYGFPIDLTKEIAAEQGLSVDERGFENLMRGQKERARADRAAKVKTSWGGGDAVPKEIEQTRFTGYEEQVCEGKVLAILAGGEPVNTLLETGTDAVVVLDRTPFYAESGGQVGDIGVFERDGEVVFEVADTQKDAAGHFLHLGVLTGGALTVGDTVKARIDTARRGAIARNHTAAHLLQAALRDVLGDHVHQAGQLVDEKRCRFDFSHFSRVTEDQLRAVEEEINGEILAAQDVTTRQMPIDEAKKLGAMALFGEKYGDIVRVVEAGAKSKEFCGGTHVSNTAQIGLCRIVSETSVAAGVRRIELLTGANVLEKMDEYERTLQNCAQTLKLRGISELPEKCAGLMAQNREQAREIERLNSKIANSKLAELFENATEIDGVKLISALLTDVKPETLRAMGDDILARGGDTIALLAGVSGERGNFCCVCSESARAKGAHAGKIIQRVSAVTGGKGGGRPESAMGGIGKPYMVDEALAALPSIVKDLFTS